MAFIHKRAWPLSATMRSSLTFKALSSSIGIIKDGTHLRSYGEGELSLLTLLHIHNGRAVLLLQE
ncbi:MAG: hypothetical protein H0U76_04375 [Ktedonobacteraceae bacterium]|nr:hypothetical protein [Ktedonobacteraceae bacterium]